MPSSNRSATSRTRTKKKGKRLESSSSHVESLAESTSHPDGIFPVVLTTATQELFGCRADVDVTAENVYKLLRREDVVRDMATRAAVSDFSPLKQLVLDYPEDEILLVFDRDFTHGQNFYLVLKPELKEGILNPVQSEAEAEEAAEAAEAAEGGEHLAQAPEHRPWASLGSEVEILGESVQETREKLRYVFSRLRRTFGKPVSFCDWTTKDSFIRFAPYEDDRPTTKRVERQRGIQATVVLTTSSTMTHWKYPKDVLTQYEPRELSPEENILQLLKNVDNDVASRFEVAMQLNGILDITCKEWSAQGEDVDSGRSAITGLRECWCFVGLHYSKKKTISCIGWHPAIRGVIAVAMTERLSVEERIDNSTELSLSPSYIIFWSFSEPNNPLLLLESPEDVFAFQFCPSDPSVIVGGCINGQVALWDISAHVKRLQETQSGDARKPPVDVDLFELEKNKKQKKDPPVVRYSGLSSIENSHKAPITDVQWLPDTFEVTRMGLPVENKNNTCVQLASCAPDGCMLFWDIRVPVGGAQKGGEGRPRVPESPHGVPDTFHHLHLSWKPLLRVTMPTIDTTGEYNPLKFSLPHSSCYRLPDMTETRPEYARLSVPSAKTLTALEDVNTRFYVGTEDGELLYTDWRLEKDKETERLYSAKPTHCFTIHDGLVNTVCRSPFFQDVILTVGGWSFAIWKEGVMTGPLLLSACSGERYTAGCWSPTQPAVLFVGRADGHLELWDLLEQTHKPAQVQNFASSKITCVTPWTVSDKEHFLAVSDDVGTLHILQSPSSLLTSSASEKLSMEKYLEKEVERLAYFEKRKEIWAQQKKVEETEAKKKKTEIPMPQRTIEQIEEESLKSYEEYLSLERKVLEELGLPPDSTHTNGSM